MHRYIRPRFLLLLTIAAVVVGSGLLAQAQSAREPCPGFEPILEVGDTGAVAPGPANNVRLEPSLNSPEIGEMTAGTQFTVLDGPVCAAGYTWWYVDAGNVQGWTAAGTPDDYFLDQLVPVEEIRAIPAAQGQEGQTNVAFILDASGSMQAALPDGERRINAAQRALGQLSSEIPEGVNASLWTFGHRVGNSEAERPQSCQDIEQLVPLGPADSQQFQAAADGVVARGWTPLTRTIQQVASTLPPASDNSIVVISDGEETCGGDPCAVAEALHDSNIELVVNTIGFDVDAATREQLQCIARVAGGQYYDAANADELTLALEQASAPNATIQLIDPSGNPLDTYYTLTAAESGVLMAEGPGPTQVPAGEYVITVEGYNPQTINVEGGQTVNITLEPIVPTATPAPPTPTPTQIVNGTYTAVDSNGNVIDNVQFELENVATLETFTNTGTVSVTPGEYRGQLRVPLADGVTQNIQLRDTGLTTIQAGEEIFINIDNYFGEPVTFQVADGAGNLLPDAQIAISGQYCIGDPFANFTGEAMRFRTRGGSQRLCLTVTANGQTYTPFSVNNLDINNLEANTQTLTVYDGLTFRTAGVQPPGIGRVQAVNPSGEPYPNGRTPFIIPTNLNSVTWWSSNAGASVATYFYAVAGEFDVSLGGTARDYLTTVTVGGGQVTPVVVVQNENGNYVAPDDTAPDDTAPTEPETTDAIFFDDFEQEGVDDLQRNYNGWANWDVVAGSVDAINATRARNADDSYGVMLDLDGSTRTSGIVTTGESFTLQPGDYTFQFEASSSGIGEDNTFRVVVTDFVEEIVTVSTEQPMQPYTYTFTVTEPTDVFITFDHTPTPGDNEGAFIDNVLLTRGSVADNSGLEAAAGEVFVESTFETGTESWTVVNGGTGPDQQFIDGEGAICSTDTGNGVYSFQAPPGWQRGWSPLVGGTLIYEIRSDPDDTAYEDVDVYLLGENAMITYDHPTNPSTSAFERIEVPLTADARWTADGQPLDEAGLRSFLSNAPRLRIRADYRNAVEQETTCLARVALLLPEDSNSTQTSSAVTTTSTTTPDESESTGDATTAAQPNNASDTAATPPPADSTLAYGQTVQGNIREGEANTWRFEGTAGDVISVLVNGDTLEGAGDAQLELRATDGTVLAASDDNRVIGERWQNPAISDFTLPADGSYVIAVSGYDEPEPTIGSYALVLEGPGGDAADTATVETLSAPSSDGTLTQGTEVQGELPSGGSNEWTFQGSAGDRVDVLVRGDALDGAADTVMEIYAPDGTLIAESDDNVVLGGNSLSPSVEALELPTDGTYTVIIRGYDERSYGTYGLLLREAE